MVYGGNALLEPHAHSSVVHRRSRRIQSITFGTVIAAGVAGKLSVLIVFTLCLLCVYFHNHFPSFGYDCRVLRVYNQEFSSPR